MKNIKLAICMLLLSMSIWAQKKDRGLESITQTSIEAQLNFIASDWFEGRETGEKGAFMTADYIASQFQLFGVKPYNSSYYQEFAYIEYDLDENQSMEIINTKGNTTSYLLNNGVDFRLNKAFFNTKQTAEVVFCGYGIIDEKVNYNDFKGIDLKGKIALIAMDYPGHLDKNSKAYEHFHPGSRRKVYALHNQKIKNAKEKGAIAILLFDPTKDIANYATNDQFLYRSGVYESTSPIENMRDKSFTLPKDFTNKTPLLYGVSPEVAEFLLADNPFTIEDFQKKASEMKSSSTQLKSKKIKLQTSVKKTVKKCQNVAGMIKGKDTTSAVIVGAHYDHYGVYNGWIYNGADDNGSGTVGVLSIARAFAMAEVQPERSVIFVCFTGEEKGLLGSQVFATRLPDNLKINYMFNMDMIGRDRAQDTLGVQCPVIYTKGNEQIKNVLTKVNEDNKFGIEWIFWESTGKSGGSDHSPFAQKDIPYSFFWTGWHDDYHQPSDETDKINWKKMTKLVKIGYLHTKEFANEK